MIAEPIHRAPLDVLANNTLVPLDLIVDAPGQPRRVLPDVDALAANIREYGLLQPVALRRVDGRYQVVVGHRRVAAYRLLRDRYTGAPEYTSISAVVSRSTDETAFLSMVSAQVHSIGWTAAEEAEALVRLLEGGLSQRDVARMLSRSEPWLSKRIRTYRDSAIGEQVRSGQVPPTVAEELLTVRAPSQRREMAEQAASEGWSRSEARQHVRRLATHPLVRDVGRRARALAKDLRSIEPASVTGEVLSDLERLALVIEQRFPRRAEKSAA